MAPFVLAARAAWTWLVPADSAELTAATGGVDAALNAVGGAIDGRRRVLQPGWALGLGKPRRKARATAYRSPACRATAGRSPACPATACPAAACRTAACRWRAGRDRATTACAPRTRTRRHLGLVDRVDRRFLDDGVVLHVDLEIEQVADRLLADRVQHRVEHLEPLPLEFDQRVAL